MPMCAALPRACTTWTGRAVSLQNASQFSWFEHLLSCALRTHVLTLHFRCAALYIEFAPVQAAAGQQVRRAERFDCALAVTGNSTSAHA